MLAFSKPLSLSNRGYSFLFLPIIAYNFIKYINIEIYKAKENLLFSFLFLSSKVYFILNVVIPRENDADCVQKWACYPERGLNETEHDQHRRLRFKDIPIW